MGDFEQVEQFDFEGELHAGDDAADSACGENGNMTTQDDVVRSPVAGEMSVAGVKGSMGGGLANAPQSVQTDMSSALPSLASAGASAASTTAPKGLPASESQALTEWKQKHEEALRAAREEEDSATRQLRQTAQAELKQWYDEKQEQVRKRQAKAQEDDKLATNLSSPAGLGADDTSLWERIVSKIDLQQSTDRDTQRMKEILIALKHEALPPKA